MVRPECCEGGFSDRSSGGLGLGGLWRGPMGVGRGGGGRGKVICFLRESKFEKD